MTLGVVQSETQTIDISSTEDNEILKITFTDLTVSYRMAARHIILRLNVKFSRWEKIFKVAMA